MEADNRGAALVAAAILIVGVFFTYWAEIRQRRIEEGCFLDAVELYRGRSAAAGIAMSDADTLKSRELEAAYQADCTSAGGMKNWHDAFNRGRQQKPPPPVGGSPR